MNISSQFVEIRIPTKFMNSNWFIYFLHPLYSGYLFPLLFLLSLPFSFFLLSLSLPLTIYLLKKKKKTQDHFHVAVLFSYLHGFQDSASIKIPQNLYPTPSTETKTIFLMNFSATGLIIL